VSASSELAERPAGPAPGEAPAASAVEPSPRPRRILFFMRHPVLNFRNFESTLRLLAARGHQIHLAFDTLGDEGDTDLVEGLARELPGLTYGRGPRASKRDPYFRLEQTMGMAADYLRYFEPTFEDAPRLRARYEARVGPSVRLATRLPLVGSRRGLRLLRRLLLWAGRSLPIAPAVRDYLRERSPDIVLLTPLVRLGSPQGAYIRAAKALGLRTALLVHSWDNLTNKGLIRDAPDFVAVWNEAQREEAVDLHGVAPERVLVTGAPSYDQWFDWRPSRDREAFCREVGLPSERPFLLYLCSSSFIAPQEAGHVEGWVKRLRAAPDPVLRSAGILVRPHWKNVDEWREVDFSHLEDVVVWPRLGANPLDRRSRSDFYDSMFHSAAIVGVNTSALIESAIVGRPVHTWLTPQFRDSQAGVPHFQHLARQDGGVLRVAESFEEHADQLAEALSGSERHRDSARRFIESFVRPLGLEVPATAALVSALEDACETEPAAPRRPSPAALVLRAGVRVALGAGSAKPGKRRPAAPRRALGRVRRAGATVGAVPSSASPSPGGAARRLLGRAAAAARAGRRTPRDRADALRAVERRLTKLDKRLSGELARVRGEREAARDAGAAAPASAANGAGGTDATRVAEHEALVAHRTQHYVTVDQPLVLVSQIDRSGGTLLSQLFDDHPQLHAHPYELHTGHPKKYLWPVLDLDAGPDEWYRMLHEPPAERAFREGYRKVAQPNAPPEDVETFPFVLPPLLQREVFEACVARAAPRTPRAVFDCYMTSYFNAWLDNRNLLGRDKRWITAFAARLSNEPASVDGLFETYPDGRLISIVRDPRSWYASARGVRDLVQTKSKERKYGTVEAGTEVWRAGTEALLANRERHGERVLLLSFDQLVADTEGTMRLVADWLGIAYDPVLTEPTFNGQPIKADSSFEVASHGVVTDPLSRFREKLSEEEIAYLEREAMPLYERALALTPDAPAAAGGRR
jgi:hypothetical protein